MLGKLNQLEQQGYGHDAAYSLKRKMSNKKGSGLKLGGQGLSLAGGGRKIQYAKRQIKEGYQHAKPYLKEYATEVGKNIVVPAMKSYLESKQKGGFIFTTAMLIAGAIAAAKAVAIGAAGALGKHAMDKALKGRGVDPAHVKTAIQRVQLTVKDFSPSAYAKIQHLTAMLNKNPQAVDKVSKMLEPLIKTSLAKKLREVGIMKGSGCLRGAGFKQHFRQQMIR